MFNEREAIKLRLEQAHQEKARLDEEIAQLLKRLRELDEQEGVTGQLKQLTQILSNLSKQFVPHMQNQPENGATAELVPILEEKEKPERKQRRKSRKQKQENKRWKTEDLLPVVVEILKENGYLCTSAELKEQLTQRTGYDPTNFTFLMNRIMKMDPRIQKPGRGQYVLQVPDETQSVQQDEPEFEQQESDTMME